MSADMLGFFALCEYLVASRTIPDSTQNSPKTEMDFSHFSFEKPTGLKEKGPQEVQL